MVDFQLKSCILNKSTRLSVDVTEDRGYCGFVKDALHWKEVDMAITKLWRYTNEKNHRIIGNCINNSIDDT